MSKLLIEANIHDADLEAFLVMVRAFDRAYPGCHFQIAGVVADNISVEDMREMLKRVGLPLVYAGRMQ